LNKSIVDGKVFVSVLGYEIYPSEYSRSAAFMVASEEKRKTREARRCSSTVSNGKGLLRDFAVFFMSDTTDSK